MLVYWRVCIYIYIYMGAWTGLRGNLEEPPESQKSMVFCRFSLKPILELDSVLVGFLLVIGPPRPFLDVAEWHCSGGSGGPKP